MAGHRLIEAHLGRLRGKLPRDTVDELADGLAETWEHHRRQGMTADQAAYEAIAEFGTPQEINDAFVASAGGRRTARILLATGPVVGFCWGASLITAQVWNWPLPTVVLIIYAFALLATVATLVAAATSRHSYSRARLGNAGAGSLLILDLAMLSAVLLGAPQMVWPMAIAVPASLIRVGLTIAALPKIRVMSRA